MKVKDDELKVILLGNSGVGKTSLLNATVNDTQGQVTKNNKATIGCYYIQKPIIINGREILLNLWDTAGSETYLGITKLFFKGSDIIILVYDITCAKSFHDLKNWMKQVDEIVDNRYVCGIVGNKNDLFLNAKVNEQEAKAFAENNNCLFKLVSAETDRLSFISFLNEITEEYIKKFCNNECVKKDRRNSIRISKISVEEINDINNNNKNNKCC